MHSHPPRFPDWPARLADFVHARRAMPFVWAQNDCCTFAAEAVLLMTGKDPMQDLRGRYSTAKGALGHIRRAGGLQPLVCRYLGMPMERVAAASRGDVVLVPASPAGPALGVCVGSEAAVAGEAGVVMVSMAVAQAAWRI